MLTEARRGRRIPKSWRSRKLSHLTWVVGIILESSAKAVLLRERLPLQPFRKPLCTLNLLFWSALWLSTQVSPLFLCVHVHMHRHVCACISQMLMPGVYLDHFPTFSFKTGSLTEPNIHQLAGLAGQETLGIHCLCPHTSAPSKCDSHK